MKPFKIILGYESAACFILGGLPLLLAQFFTETESLALTIITFIPSEFLVWYGLAWFAVSSVILTLNSYFNLLDPKSTCSIFLFEINASLLGTLRMVTGFLICYPIFLWFNAPTYWDTTKLYLLYGGGMGLAECYLLSLLRLVINKEEAKQWQHIPY